MSYKKNTGYQDFYSPRDFYGWASSIAKHYCKTHPEADKNTVYYAASEAAEMYEFSRKLRYKPFKNFVYFRIHTAVYIKNRKEDETMAITPEIKETMIKDYQSGMTVKEIADRYQLNPKITYNNFLRWSQKGLVELRASRPEYIKREPAPAEAETSPSQEVVNNNIPQSDEVVNPLKPEPAPQEPPKPTYTELCGKDIISALRNGKKVYILEKSKAAVRNINEMKTAYFALLLEILESEEKDRYYIWAINEEETNEP